MGIHTGVRAHRFMIGSIACAIVSDGSFSYPDPAKLLFANAPYTARTAQLRGHGIDPETWNEYVSPYSALLIETGHHWTGLPDLSGLPIPDATKELLVGSAKRNLAPLGRSLSVCTVIRSWRPVSKCWAPGSRSGLGWRSAIVGWRRVADENLLVHGAHFPWPGLGHVRRQNRGFCWQPVSF